MKILAAARVLLQELGGIHAGHTSVNASRYRRSIFSHASWRTTSQAVILLLLLSLRAEAQGGRAADAPIIVVPPQEEKVEEGKELAAPLIGMEAYREILASGQYLVGPGDEFLIHIAGMEEPFFTKVMAEGGLFVPSVGSVQIAGLSLADARKKVEEAFHRIFRQGEITVELNKLRNFPVTVVGVVGTPGVTMASGIERISEVLRKAGGLGSKASRRNIRIVKTGKLDAEEWDRVKAVGGPYDFLEREDISRRVDLELYGVTGDTQYNPFVEDGDLVVVLPQKGRIGVVGAVQRGGFFEFVEGDHLSDLLTLAQGLAPGFDQENVRLFRYNLERKNQFSIAVDIAGVLARDRQADLLVQAEDWLVVRDIPGYNPNSTVRIIGEVVYPGFYVVEKNKTTLRELIDQAGGFTEDASLWEARIIRQQMRGEGGEGEIKDPEFERIASVPVADRKEDDNQYFIMKSREKPGHIVVDFVALFEEDDASQNIALLPGDVIYVPATPNTVMVSGQAAYPGAVIFNPDYTVWDYIERAGGLGWRASKDIRVIKVRTGEMKRARDVVRIDPGDRIWIKENPERDYWAIFTGTMAVIGQVSTVVLLYATLSN